MDKEIELFVEDLNREIVRKNAVRGKATNRLPEILSRMSKAQCYSLASDMNLPGRSKWNKADLEMGLATHLVQLETIQDTLLLADDEEWNEMLSFLDQPIKQGNDVDLEHCQHFLRFGLLFSFLDEDELTFAMPVEIGEVLNQLNLSELNRIRRRCQLVHQYCSAATNLYGALKLAELIDIYHSHNQETMAEEDWYGLIDVQLKRHPNYGWLRGYLVSDYYLNFPEELDELLDEIQNKPAYRPPKEEFLKYADLGYFEMTPQLRRLRTYLLNQLCKDPQLVDDLIDDIQLACSMEEAIENMLDEFTRRGIRFKSENQLDQLLRMLVEVYNHTRLWTNRGHTPHEMMAISGKAKDLKPLHSPIMIGDKVGRNEPCPCGSGKKYKRCCGKS